MRDFHGLSVWKKAHDLTAELDSVTRTLPREELFGLTSQIRRSAASVLLDNEKHLAHEEKVTEVKRMLTALMTKVRADG